MVSRPKTVSVMIAASVLAAATSAAGEMRGHDRHAHHFFRSHSRVIVSGGITPVPVPGIDTYVGDVSVSDIPGTGLFLTFGPGLMSQPGDAVVVAPRAKIVDVPARAGVGACSMEHGVCVIRAQ